MTIRIVKPTDADFVRLGIGKPKLSSQERRAKNLARKRSKVRRGKKTNAHGRQ